VPLHHDHLPTGRPLDPDGPVGRYRVERDTPLFPFGWGGGQVAYSHVRTSAPTLRPGGSAQVTARLTNTGSRPVLETAQLYVRDEVASVSRPVSELAGVELVRLGPGESRTVSFVVDESLLSYRDAAGEARAEAGFFTLSIAPHAGGGGSTRIELLAAEGGEERTRPT
jgi:beta-glucosidase